MRPRDFDTCENEKQVSRFTKRKFPLEVIIKCMQIIVHTIEPPSPKSEHIDEHALQGRDSFNIRSVNGTCCPVCAWNMKIVCIYTFPRLGEKSPRRNFGVTRSSQRSSTPINAFNSQAEGECMTSPIAFSITCIHISKYLNISCLVEKEN